MAKLYQIRMKDIVVNLTEVLGEVIEYVNVFGTF